jgi:type IV secretory pathway TraG/TraD family ATPase VirD4
MSRNNDKPRKLWVTGCLELLLGVALWLVATVAEGLHSSGGKPAIKELDAGPIIDTVSMILKVVAVVAALLGIYAIGRAMTPRHRNREWFGHGGWATSWALFKHMSATALRWRPGKGRTVRVALWAITPWWKWSRMPISELGSFIGTTVVGPPRPKRVYASLADVTLLYAPPQTGKSAMLGGFIIDAPGSVVTTSTKPDLYEHTARLRALRGQISIFNPENVGGLQSTFRWSPVAGCEHHSVAEERARHLVLGAKSTKGLQDAGFWDSQATKVLRVFLMAAAVSGRTMRDVAGWVAAPNDPTPLELLRRNRDRVPEGWEQELRATLETEASRTRDSIFMTLNAAVQFMHNPDIAATCMPQPGDGQFTVSQFVAAPNTLYLLGGDSEGTLVAPLFTALTAHIFEESKRIAAQEKVGERLTNRLSLPLSLILDEVALITPVPLDRWCADAGGRAIQLAVAAQAPSQVIARWGDEGKNTIETASNAKVYFGGLTVTRDLESISAMCGKRKEDHWTETAGRGGGSRSKSSREVPIMPPDKIRMLPEWHVLVVYRTMAPTICRMQPVWTRRDVKRSRKTAQVDPSTMYGRPQSPEPEPEPVAAEPVAPQQPQGPRPEGWTAGGW